MRGISLGLVTAALTAAIAIGQPPDGKPANPGGKIPDDLEKLIALALSHSADVQLADAKRREAEAELHRARVNVMQRMIDLTSAIEIQKNQLAFAEASLTKLTKLRQAGLPQASEDEVRQAISRAAEAKATLTRSEKQLELLIGAGPARQSMPDAAIIPPMGLPGPGAIGGGAGLGNPDAQPARPPSPAMVDRIRKALDTPVKSADFDAVELTKILSHYRSLSSVPIVFALGDRGGETITLKLDKELPLGAHLQALQDLAPGLHITVRDYGLLCTFDVMPDDGMTVLDFWQGKPR